MADLAKHHVCIRECLAANKRSFSSEVPGLEIRIDSLQEVRSYIRTVLRVRLVVIV